MSSSRVGNVSAAGMDAIPYHDPAKLKPEDEESSDDEQQQLVRPRRTRALTKSVVLEAKEVFFKLFKFTLDKQEYLLEMHWVASGIIERFRVELIKDNNNKWRVEDYDLETGNFTVYAITEDPYRPKFAKEYQLSLQERLDGWTVERRMRTPSGIKETFYMHASRGQFRSLKAASSFMVYSCSKVQSLQEIEYDGQEEEAKEEIRIVSVEEIRNDGTSRRRDDGEGTSRS